MRHSDWSDYLTRTQVTLRHRQVTLCGEAASHCVADGKHPKSTKWRTSFSLIKCPVSTNFDFEYRNWRKIIALFKSNHTRMLIKTIIRIPPRITNMKLPTSNIYNSATMLLDDKWRDRNRLPKNTNAFGPLTNMPDYTFKDGRPAPFGVKQMIRIDKNREYLMKIKRLTGEMDHAINKHRRMEEQRALEKQRIIDSKLKPKDYLL